MRSETHLPNAHKSHKANPNSKSFTHRKKLLFNHILLYIFKSKIFKMLEVAQFFNNLHFSYTSVLTTFVY